MTESSGEQPNARDLVEQEHAQVRAMARQIRGIEDVDVLLPLLKEHRAMLGHHFAAEEAEDGLYDSLLEEAPEQQHRVMELRAQHQELLNSIDSLCTDAQGDAPPNRAQILERARAIAGRLDVHEAQENGLVFDVFETDIGVGD